MRLLRIVRACLLVSAALTVGIGASASEDGGLSVEGYTLVERTDAFGLAQVYAEGVLRNTDPANAYQDISLFAEVYDAADALIGEGIGFAVNACRSGTLPDFTLEPQQTVRYSIRLELDTAPDDIARIDILPTGQAVAPQPVNPFLTYDDLIAVADGDVVALEWIDSDTLRYGVGCHQDVFTALSWAEYTISTGVSEPLDEHPNAVFITDALLERAELTDPVIFNRSFLNFHPEDTRIVYQTAINTLMTIERDGTFKRLLYDDLSRVSLQGYSWLPEGRFLAYYYGAYGEPVRYVTASMAGQRISRNPLDARPSLIVPGATPDGARVVIAAEIDGVTGYYLHSTTSTLAQLLFEAEPPGNNYPAPIYRQGAAGRALIYIIRPVQGGQVRLQCYDSALQRPINMAIMPLNLTSNDRSGSQLSPDNRYLAVYADGQHGGLWLYDLQQSPACRED